MKLSIEMVGLLIGGLLVGVLARAEPPATRPAAEKKPASIFDFGLEPLPNTEIDKEESGKTQPPAARPAPAESTPSPGPVHSKPPESAPLAHNDPAPAAALDTKSVINSIHIDANGVMTADRVVTLGLQGTENQHFIVDGELFTVPEPTPINSGQVYFRLRHANGKKDIFVNLGGMRAKRMLFGGETIHKVGPVIPLEGLEREKWYPFRIEAGPDGVDLKIGSQHIAVRGATETAGKNLLVLGPGGKVQNLKITVMQSGTPGSAPQGNANPSPPRAPAADPLKSNAGVPAAPRSGLDPPPSVTTETTILKSPAAVAAVGREEAAVKHADEAHKQSLLSAKHACLKDLDAAFAAITQSGNLAEANRIDAARRRIAADAALLASGGRLDPGVATADPPKSIRAAEALKREEILTRHAAETRALAIAAAKRQCAKELDAAIKSSMAAGNLDEANRIASVKKRIEGGIDSAPAAKPLHTPVITKADAILFISGDDHYALYVNGQPLCEGRPEIIPHQARLGVGDVITVKCEGKRYEGFACLIAFPNSHQCIYSGKDHWKAYTPKNPLRWFDPAGITSATAATVGSKSELKAEHEVIAPHFAAMFSGSQQQVIWGTTHDCYLTLTITAECFQELTVKLP